MGRHVTFSSGKSWGLGYFKQIRGDLPLLENPEKVKKLPVVELKSTQIQQLCGLFLTQHVFSEIFPDEPPGPVWNHAADSPQMASIQSGAAGKHLHVCWRACVCQACKTGKRCSCPKTPCGHVPWKTPRQGHLRRLGEQRNTFNGVTKLA